MNSAEQIMNKISNDLIRPSVKAMVESLESNPDAWDIYRSETGSSHFLYSGFNVVSLDCNYFIKGFEWLTQPEKIHISKALNDFVEKDRAHKEQVVKENEEATLNRFLKEQK